MQASSAGTSTAPVYATALMKKSGTAQKRLSIASLKTVIRINMELTYKLIRDSATFEAFRSQLKASDLPADDLDYTKDLLVGYYEGDQLVGTGGLEVYGDYALLRSLSVKMGI